MKINLEIGEISDAVKIIRVSREKACLGFYEESIEKFEVALKIIRNHWKTVSDDYTLNRWKTTEKSLEEEVDLVKKLAETTDIMRNNSSPDIKKQRENQDERLIKLAISGTEKLNSLEEKATKARLIQREKAPDWDAANKRVITPAYRSRYGGLKPFDHHKLPKELIKYDEEGNIINPSDLMNHDCQKDRKI